MQVDPLHDNPDPVPAMYHRLKAAAVMYLGEVGGAGHTLQPTAVLHEAMLRLSAGQRPEADWWRDPTRYFEVCTRVMRQVLIDHARWKSARKRSSGEAAPPTSSSREELPEEHFLAIDEAIEGLRGFDPSAAHVVEMKFYLGLSSPQVAKALNRSLSSVDRDWRAGRAWLRRRLESQAEEHRA